MNIPSKKYRVLLADDNAIDRKTFQSILDDSYIIEVVEDGKQAIKFSKESLYDVIVLDIMMPYFNGYEACQEIKNSTLNQHTPIIFVTAKTDMKSLLRGFEYGASDYIVKPYFPEELKARLKNHAELYRSKKEIREKNDLDNEKFKHLHYLASIVQSSEDQAVIKDLDLRIIAANQAWLNNAGGKLLIEVIGKTDMEVFNTPFAEQYMKDDKAAQKLKPGECIKKEENYTKPDGEIIIIATKKFPVFDDNEKLIATANISRDVTQERKTADKLKKLNQELEKRVDERAAELEKQYEERKKAVKALRESELRFRGIYKNVSIGLFQVSTNGFFKMANPTLRSLLNIIKKEEVKSLNFFDVFFSDPVKRNSFWEKIKADGEVRNMQLIWIDAEGNENYIKLGVKAFYDSFGEISTLEGYVEDITQTKQSEKELSLKEKQYRLLFDNMSNGFILQEALIDLDGTVLDFYYLEMNKALQEIMGEYYKPYKFIGRTMQEVPLKFASNWFNKCKEVAVQGKQYQFEHYLKELDKYFDILLYQPQKGQVASIINDITDRKRAQEKITHQYKEIKQQNKIIAQKNQRITDSINYAQRIQQAMLPSKNRLKQYFKDVMIFYRPKDIVSGDFYWFSSKENLHFIAVADCTGHGVPGGYMSMVGHDLLNTIINIQGIYSPDMVLTEMHHRIRKIFQNDEDEILDGMDIGLCAIDIKNNTLEYAGARMPLIIFQNGNLNKIKANGISVAVLPNNNEVLFKKTKISFEKNSTFYLYSDGFQDQFGGENKKKMYPQVFEKLLADIYVKAFAEQKTILDNTIDNWMKGFDQLDDMLILGIKI